jgi:hypothetical protein
MGAAPRLDERLAEQDVVLRLEELHERPLYLAVAHAHRVHAGAVHARHDVTGHPLLKAYREFEPGR